MGIETAGAWCCGSAAYVCVAHERPSHGARATARDRAAVTTRVDRKCVTQGTWSEVVPDRMALEMQVQKQLFAGGDVQAHHRDPPPSTKAFDLFRARDAHGE